MLMIMHWHRYLLGSYLYILFLKRDREQRPPTPELEDSRASLLSLQLSVSVTSPFEACTVHHG